MREHDQIKSGDKQEIFINQLTEEYLKLANHGFGAKNSTFSAIFETYYDPSAKRVKIMHQESSRVLLNLLNNGFYAVTEKRDSSIAPMNQ